MVIEKRINIKTYWSNEIFKGGKMRKINVMEHELVPEHHLISEEEEKA